MNKEGTQCHLDKIFPSVTQIRYSDDKGTTFLHAALNGEDYWNAITKTPGPVAVRYVRGRLAGPIRYIETSHNIHWGHRNNRRINNGKE